MSVDDMFDLVSTVQAVAPLLLFTACTSHVGSRCKGALRNPGVSTFHLDSALRLQAECGSSVSLGMRFEDRGRLLGFVLCSHWASMHKVHI